MKKLQPLIKQLKLDYINQDITDKNFPYQETKGEVKLIDFKKYISTNDALKELDDRGYRPATVHEMLAWAKKNWNGEDWIVALGSVWQNLGGDRHCPCLYGDGSKRGLYLFWLDRDFGERCRFGAVRKSSDPRTP